MVPWTGLIRVPVVMRNHFTITSRRALGTGIRMQCAVVPYFAIAQGEGVVCCERLVGGRVQSVDDQAMEPKDEHCVGRRVDDDTLGVVGTAVLGAVEEGADVVEGAGGAAVEEDAAHWEGDGGIEDG